VPLCAGAVPEKKGNRIVPKGKTALGGDNRTGVGTLVTLATTLMKQGLPHPPLTLLFTVREESGLWGARFVDLNDLGNPSMGFNVDGPSPREITIGATGAERWEIEIFGKAAHAGGHPERGISSSVVFSLALAEVFKGGWFGKIKKAGKEGTSNIGPIGDDRGRSAGQATNVVTDYLKAYGESRSHDTAFNKQITQAYKDAFQKAAQRVTNHEGKKAKVKFTARRDYYPFRLKETSPVVRAAQAAAGRMGWETTLRITNGGLDANWMVRNGVPTITLGAGQNNVHTIDEFVDVQNYLDGCRYALALVTQA
jgi:tripeptide aminopeptidase